MSSPPASNTTAALECSRRSRGVAVVRRALEARGAVAFVHAGVATAPTLRYLSGLDEPADCAVVVDAERVVVCLAPADPLSGADSRDEDSGRARGDRVRVVDDPGRAAAELVAEWATAGTVLAPPSIPHDCALHLENAGFDLASSTAVTETRRAKTDAERRALRRLGDATRAALDRARTLLASASVDGERRLTVPEAVLTVDVDGVNVDGNRLETDGERLGDDVGVDGTEVEAGAETDRGEPTQPLTPELLRREMAVTLARHGAEAGGSDVRTARDGSAADPLRAGRQILLDCRPRGLGGVRCRGTWTAVVDGDGGWQRRAHVAVDAALRAALHRAAVGETAEGVETELRAELTAYGFDDATAVVHGVGLAAREGPTGSEELTEGTALVVGGRVDGDDGAVACCETVLVDDDVTTLVGRPSRLSV